MVRQKLAAVASRKILPKFITNFSQFCEHILYELVFNFHEFILAEKHGRDNFVAAAADARFIGAGILNNHGARIAQTLSRLGSDENIRSLDN